jgi:hypothetical protein
MSKEEKLVKMPRYNFSSSKKDDDTYGIGCWTTTGEVTGEVTGDSTGASVGTIGTGVGAL